jgi:colanic acid biosynthesis glycosyl transferase WcaI
VRVVCGQPSYRALKLKGLPRSEKHKGVSIERVWSYIPSRRTIPQRLVHYGSYFTTSLLRSLASYKPDVCLVMSTPPLLLGVSGVLLRALKGVPFIYSVQDLYPDIAIHLGVLKPNAPTTHAIEHLNRVCYRAAAALVALSPAMGDRLEAKGVAGERIHVIPNWADTGSVVPCARDNAFARQHGLCDDFVLQYAGNIGLSQGLESIVDAAVELRDLPIKFAMVGDGNARTSLESAVRTRGLNNVLFLPPQPRERLAHVLGACDVGLVSMRRGVAGDLVPSKLYGIMAASRPVLAAVEPGSEVARVVQERQCGWVVGPEHGGQLASGIRAAYEAERGELRRRGANGRRACVQLYSRAAVTRRYHELIEQVAHR